MHAREIMGVTCILDIYVICIYPAVVRHGRARNRVCSWDDKWIDNMVGIVERCSILHSTQSGLERDETDEVFFGNLSF